MPSLTSACERIAHFTVLMLAGTLVLAAGAANAAGAGVRGADPGVRDLSALGLAAERLAVPIVLMISRSDCGYCERLKHAVLTPLELSGELVGRALLRELLTDDGTPVTDFDGHKRPAANVAARYDAPLTPTLLFLGPDGVELAPRIVGISNLDFYAWYLDQSIAAASGALRRFE